MKVDIQKLIELAKKHRDQDDYVRGKFGEETGGVFKGCSVGCTIRDINPNQCTSDHNFLAESLGVPEDIIYLQEYFFENLDDNKNWTVDFLSAIPTTTDNAIPKFLLAIAPAVNSEYYRLTKSYLEEWRDTGVKNEESRKAAESAVKSSAEEAGWSAEWLASLSACSSSWVAGLAVREATRESVKAAALVERSRKNKEMSEILLEIMRGEK